MRDFCYADVMPHPHDRLIRHGPGQHQQQTIWTYRRAGWAWLLLIFVLSGFLWQVNRWSAQTTWPEPHTRALLASADQASTALASGQVDAAIRLWQRLLTLDNNDAEARNGIAHAVQILAERAIEKAVAGRFAEAEAILAKAHALVPDAPAICSAELHLNRARQSLSVTVDTRTPSLQALGTCFDTHLAANDLRRASECLLRANLQGETVATLARRRQLALRWLAIADERLRRSELSAASRVLANAQATDSAIPGLDALTQRLEIVTR